MKETRWLSIGHPNLDTNKTDIKIFTFIKHLKQVYTNYIIRYGHDSLDTLEGPSSLKNFDTLTNKVIGHT